MLRNFLEKSTRQPIAVIFVLIAGFAAYFSLRSSISGDEADRAASGKMYIDSTNSEPFYHTIVKGEKSVVQAPSGGMTGYPAEACYWTKEGTIKEKPTYVLLNRFLNRPGPTFCPDCGRLVTSLNPQPHPGDKPPPTKAELGNRPVPSE